MTGPFPPPAATLTAITSEAIRALGGRAGFRITRFPFRIGRERRSPQTPKAKVTDLREGAVLPVNDLYLIEPTDVDVLFISREHFLIDYENGTFVLVDRGSVCGTLVGARRIGGDRTGGRALLRHRDKITIGNDSSPYVFRFDIVVPAP